MLSFFLNHLLSYNFISVLFKFITSLGSRRTGRHFYTHKLFAGFSLLFFFIVLLTWNVLAGDSILTLSFNIEFWISVVLLTMYTWKVRIMPITFFRKNVTQWSLLNCAVIGGAAGNIEGWRRQTSSVSGYEPLELIDLTQDWCFLVRLLSGIDPFDASRWISWLSYPQAFLSKYVCAPEFFQSHVEWVQAISKFNVTDNISFFCDVDMMTRLFILFKFFGRYGTYLPELIFFSWLIYLMVTKENTVKAFNGLIFTIQFCILSSVLTSLLPFAPAELFTGYKADGYSEVVKVIFLVLVFFYFSAISVWEVSCTTKKEVYVVTVFFLFFSLIMISCSNLWIFFFALEGVSFCVITFFVFNFSGQGHISDAVRYFCLNAIASGALLLSLGLGEYVTGTADYNEFENFFLLNSTVTTVPNSFTLAVILFLVGSLFKLGVFPFNIYEIDTYKKASYIVIYFSSIITKAPFFFIWLKLVWRVIPFIKIIFPILLVLGLLTAVIGTLGASLQTVLRPFLAYSSMSHIGLILVSFTTETLLGVDVACLYFLTYIIAMSVIYMILNALEGAELDLHGVHQLRELRANFSLACCFTLGVLTLAGFPLTLGFFAKIGLLMNLALMGQFWLVVIILVLNLISFGYYLRVLKIIWVEVNAGAALKYVLTDMKKVQKISAGRTLFEVQILATLLVLLAIILIFSFKFVIVITSTLLCVAIYSVDWWVFIRTGLIGLKTWLLYSPEIDRFLLKAVELREAFRRVFAASANGWRGKNLIDWLFPKQPPTDELFEKYGISKELIRADQRARKLAIELHTVYTFEERLYAKQERFSADYEKLLKYGERIIKGDKSCLEAGDKLREDLKNLSKEMEEMRRNILSMQIKAKVTEALINMDPVKPKHVWEFVRRWDPINPDPGWELKRTLIESIPHLKLKKRP